MKERDIHRVFVVSVLLKAGHALIECASGLLLYTMSTATITALITAMTFHELNQDPHDLVANTLLNMAQTLSVGTQHFYAFYLLSHGLIKAVLAIGLLANLRWAYPASLVAMAGFIVYQLYRFSFTHSPALIVLTIFDLFVVVLVLHEWRLMRRHDHPHPVT